MESNFKKLLENIKLTDPQKEDAKTKVKSVCDALQEKYYPTLQYDGSTKLLIGSYGKQTNIRPPKDIDLLFRMPESEFARFDGLLGNKQSQLLQEIREVLKDKFSTTEEIKAFGKVIVVNFSEGTHTIELLPAWQMESGSYRIPNTENGGSWNAWNPVAELSNIDASSSETKHTRSLIRILKCWVRFCGVPMKSFVVEILVVDYLKQKFNNQVNVIYPQLTLGFFEFLKTKKNSAVFSPASSSSISIGEEWFSRAESAYSRAEKAVAFEADGKFRDASLEWQKIFGTDFPVAEDKVFNESFEDKINQLTKTYPSTEEQDITGTYGHKRNLSAGYSVTIDAKITYQKGFSPGTLSSYLSKKFPLLKGNKLLFEVKTINVPSPYSVMWKVRNFGEEANSARGLRGEISRDAGRFQKEEHTKYHGEHYVECYAIKDGECVAVGKILVPIGKNYE